MSDGNIYVAEDSIYLQIGELQECSEAPFVYLEIWEDDLNLYCQQKLHRFFIPKDWIKSLPPNYYCVDLSLESFSVLDKDIFCELTPIATLSPAQLQTIKDCAKKICGPAKQLVKKFF